MHFQLQDLNYDYFDTFFYLFKDFFRRYKNSETTKARNLKFKNMISLYMKLSTWIFGGVTFRGLRQKRQKLVRAKFNK